MPRGWPVMASALASAIVSPANAALGSGGDDGASIWRVGAALLLCLALAVAGAFALRARTGGGALLPGLGGGPRRLRLQESLRVSPQVQLCIIACDGREMLIATSPSGAHLVAEIGASPA